MYKELEKFTDKLIEEKKYDNLDLKVKEQIKKDLFERLDDRINAVILEKMPPEKLEEFEKLIDSAKDEEIQKFCLKNIPDLDQIIALELINFRATYLHI